MSYGNNQFNMTSTLTTNLLLGYLNTTTVADDSLITDALVFTAGTLLVLGRSKDALAEQTVTFGLIGAIVDGLRLGDLTKRTLEDLFRRSQSDGYLGKVCLYFCIFLESHILIYYLTIYYLQFTIT